MRFKYGQLSLFNNYSIASDALENDKPKFFKLMDDFICWDELIPYTFYNAFYAKTGRKRVYMLESFITMLVIQRVFGYTEDSQLLNTLRYSKEMRSFCGLKKVPDAAKLTAFKKRFVNEIAGLFEKLVELTDKICSRIDPKLAERVLYDTTGIECYVSENNSKFANMKLRQAKTIAKNTPGCDPYQLVYSLYPASAEKCADAKHQYINGHYCYAMKSGIVTNGLGIVRHISFFDDDFKLKHPEIIIGRKVKNPDEDKEIGDSSSLIPVLSDYFKAHPKASHSVFVGDAAFDKYDHYSTLLNGFRFKKAVIPMNQRNSSGHLNTEIPCCPIDGTPFNLLGKSGGKNRSVRLKWVCHKSIPSGTSRICTCETPCTQSAYGRCCYTYDNGFFREFPGIDRDSKEWADIYKGRTVIERTITSFKDNLCLGGRKTRDTKTLKADIYLCGIVQLISVILADRMGELRDFKKVRKLIA